MQTKITIRNEAQTCYIDIEGTIGVPEKNQFENAASRVATFETFRKEVARIAEINATNIVVNIRSTGGDVNDALLIYDALQGLDARITTRCYGYTASAATIIAQAANEGCREISTNAMYLIHKSTCAIEGNSSSLDARAELLRKTDERLAHLYAMHSGREVEHFVQLMSENNGEGRWLTAEETVAAGLADRIIDNVFVGSLIPDTNADDLPADIAQTPKLENSIASEIIRFILGKLAYRLEEWIEQLRDKHIAKRKERLAEKEFASEEIIDEATLPQADATQAPQSSILFDEGQRRYTATQVKATEDPSMSTPHIPSNEKAYADDAKAFGRY
ncbi:MAG: Clp protease ClpP [Rikenellaceae bacterium]|nr:Clp protease ClpP [Rikenellaceae bacterium]